MSNWCFCTAISEIIPLFITVFFEGAHFPSPPRPTTPPTTHDQNRTMAHRSPTEFTTSRAGSSTTSCGILILGLSAALPVGGLKFLCGLRVRFGVGWFFFWFGVVMNIGHMVEYSCKSKKMWMIIHALPLKLTLPWKIKNIDRIYQEIKIWA